MSDDKEEVLISVPLGLVKAVAHIGTDFGYGKFELPDEYIALAQQILNDMPPLTKER